LEMAATAGRAVVALQSQAARRRRQSKGLP
jgi:hypothetical protein